MAVFLVFGFTSLYHPSFHSCILGKKNSSVVLARVEKKNTSWGWGSDLEEKCLVTLKGWGWVPTGLRVSPAHPRGSQTSFCSRTGQGPLDNCGRGAAAWGQRAGKAEREAGHPGDRDRRWVGSDPQSNPLYLHGLRTEHSRETRAEWGCAEPPDSAGPMSAAAQLALVCRRKEATSPTGCGHIPWGLSKQIP